MNTGGILALDLSCTTGWAYGGLDDPKPLSGTWILPRMSDLPACFVAIENELDDALALHRPSLVLVEAPLDKQQTTARLLLGLAAHTLSTCYRHSVPCREQAASTMRLAILGRGRFSEPDPKDPDRRINGTANAKRAVLDWCHAQGWHDIIDHNEGDAVVAWAYAVREVRARQRALAGERAALARAVA